MASSAAYPFECLGNTDNQTYPCLSNSDGYNFLYIKALYAFVLAFSDFIALMRGSLEEIT